MILAIETSSDVLSIALGYPGACPKSPIIDRRNIEMPRSTMTEMIPAIDELLRDNAMTIEMISAIAVGTGPGSYTGLRIGVVMARTFAQTLGVPIIGIPSTDSIIFSNLDLDVDIYCPIVDAKRGEVYYALYCGHDEIPKRLSIFKVVTPADLVKRLEIEDFSSIGFAGDGVKLYADVITEMLGSMAVFAPAERNVPRAEALIYIARIRIKNNNYDDAYKLVPIYVRPSQAEEMWEKRQKGAIV